MARIILVVDSSVIIKWLSGDKEELLEEANKIINDTQAGKVILIAPELAKYEVGNVLLFSKKLSPDQAEIALHQLFNIPIDFIPETEKLASKTYDLAHKLGITYYDAAFLSVAEQLNAVLVTDNIKHQGKDSNIKVIALKDY